MALHAGMALVLMVGFYLLAIGLAGALVGLIYLDATNTEQGVHPKLILICAIGAGMILWSVVPRPDRFAPPGPCLDRQQQPRLFAEIDRIARAARQESPAEVYLVGDINAWVMERGGVLGLGSRRVMGLGLPLMHVLTQSEFSAVLAHEFGHFHGGDTRLGPWIHKTRAAIERTVQSLGTQGSLLQLPFLWYGRMFLRVTHAISRRQEFIADALAAQLAGAHALASGLRQGATLHAAPGENVSVQLADRRLEPFSVFPQLVDGKRVASVWLAEADAWGIRDLPLGVPDAESGN